jgi:hypothetical protein
LDVLAALTFVSNLAFGASVGLTKLDRTNPPLKKTQGCAEFTPKERWRDSPSLANLSPALVGILPKPIDRSDYQVRKVSLADAAKTLFLRYERGPLNHEAFAPPPGLFHSKWGVLAEPQPDHLEKYGHVALNADGQHATVVLSEFGKEDFVSSFLKVPVNEASATATVKLASFEGMPLAVEFSRSGQKAVAMMREGYVNLFNPDLPTSLTKVALGPDTASLHSRFSADEKTLAVCVVDTTENSLKPKEIRLIDVVAQIQLGSLPFEGGRCRSFDLSPDGKQVFFSRDNTLYAWQVGSGEERRLGQLPDSPTQLAHSPSGPFLLIGSYNEKIFLANSISGSLLAEIRVGKDWVWTGLIGFGDNGSDFFASTDSTDLAWGDLNRLAGPPSSVRQALRDLGSDSIRAFQATRWLSCQPSALQAYLETHSKAGALPTAVRGELEAMVRDWDSEKFRIRHSATLGGMKALEELDWGQEREALTLVEALVSAALKKSASPLEIQYRYQEWLKSGDLTILKRFQESESYHHQIDAILGKPFPWKP